MEHWSGAARGRVVPPFAVRPSCILELGPRGLAAVAVPLLAALALGAGPALGAPACARQVVADWYDNGRVDRLYPLHCYREAIKTLPNDVLTYSSAREDINRALQFATRGKSDPGEGAQPPASPSPPSPPATSPPAPPPATTGKGTTTPRPTTPSTTAPEPVDTGVTEAAPPVDTSGPSAVPMPLIVLGGLALLLLAAGSAGYVTRRLQARRGGDGGEPPVAL